MTERQAIITQALKDKSLNNVVFFVHDMKATFTGEEIRIMLNVNRNRYNYLVQYLSLQPTCLSVWPGI